jgi:RNA polymerase sigma factor (sigma-70 family)
MQVLADLYQRYMELVYGVCLQYMKDPETAKDCVINIYEELITKLKKYEVEHFKPWLYQLAKNHCLMKLRSAKKIPVHVDHEFVHLEENIHLHDAMEKEEQFNRMEHCIGQLVHEQRQVIKLFYLEEKCYKTIAASTGLDLNKVRSFIQNGRRNLKICMEKKAMESN